MTLANQLPKFGNNASIANKGRNGPEFTITSGLLFLIALITAPATLFEEIVPKIMVLLPCYQNTCPHLLLNQEKSQIPQQMYHELLAVVRL